MTRLMRLIFFVVIIFLSQKIYAEKYWVSFTDKSGVTFDPYTYFSQRTIDQRINAGISLSDSSDFPVSENYCNSLKNYCDSLGHSSRWLNGIAVYTSANNADVISGLPFVKSVLPMTATVNFAMHKNARFRLNDYNLALLHYQTDRLGGKDFAARKINGKGIMIAILDGGFKGADVNPVFKKLRDEKRIIATYDFVKNRENVYVSHWHGSAVLSCITGETDSVPIGLATGAEILLARTEMVSHEAFSEEENWLAAAEWADKNGANIITSSLGYTYQRYFSNEMNGKVSLIAHAATIAASKGILVINSAGNEAENSWHYIGTPADADSVLAVGGTDPETDLKIGFSSFGPTSDGRLKPNVTAPGLVVCADVVGLHTSQGTSFSSPLVTGFAACAWQTNRSLTNMQLFPEIEKSGHLYPYFDYAHGYGIPQAKHFLDTSAVTEPTFDFVIVNDEIKVVLREKYSYPQDETSMGYEAHRNFFYKVQSKNGTVKSYTVYLADKKEMLDLKAEDFSEGDEITVHFEGYTRVLDFPKIEQEEVK